MSHTCLRYGYTIADLQRLARLVAATTPTGTGYTDRYAEAYSAIAEHLYASTERPDDHDLVHAGRDAVLTEKRRLLRQHGYAAPTDRAEGGVGTGPRFVAYWDWAAQPTPSPENKVVDRVAVGQIMPLLMPKELAAVNALAAFGDHQSAAAALGMNYKQFCDNLNRGRRRFLTWWHEGEVPSRPWTSDRRDGGADARDGRRVMKRFRQRQQQRNARVLIGVAS